MDIVRENSYQTPFMNSTVLPTILMSLSLQKHSPDTAKIVGKEYDYVIGKWNLTCYYSFTEKFCRNDILLLQLQKKLLLALLCEQNYFFVQKKKEFKFYEK